MSFADDIFRIADRDRPKKGLRNIQERPFIPATTTPPKPVENADIKPPLTMTVLTTETVRVYQNNDDTSDNWVDVERALTVKIVDANNKEFDITSITWPETE